MLDCHIYPVHALHALSPNGPCALQYYDIPSPSLRNAVYQEMQADIAPFKVGVARKQSALLVQLCLFGHVATDVTAASIIIADTAGGIADSEA